MSNKEATTTAIAKPSFLDALDQLPADIPGAATFEPGRLSWLHGINAGGVKTPGVFYAKDSAFVAAPSEPWVVDTRFAEEGEMGYSAPRLNIAVIASRSQWYTPGADKGDPITWLLEYREGAKKMTEYLVRVQGIDEVMVLSMSGKYKGAAFEDILREYRRNALARAMRAAKRSLPPWSFWLPIANKLRDGKTEYVKASDGNGSEYGSVVTPPALVAAPEARTLEEIVADAELFKEFTESGWTTYKRMPRGAVEAEYTISESLPQLESPRNVPVAITDDDLPF